MKIPLYALGDTSPDDDMTWVVRTRDPFLLLKVEPRGLTGLRCHAWPMLKAGDKYNKNWLNNIIARMAEIWCSTVDQLTGLPSNWSYVFDENLNLPPYLLLDGVEEEWTGVLRLQPPKFIVTINDEENGLAAHLMIDQYEFPDQPLDDAAALARMAREAGDYYAQYQINEDALD